MLQNYLQTALGLASRYEIILWDQPIPLVLCIALALLLICLIVFYRQMDRYYFVAFGMVLFQLWLGQQISDY